MTRPPLVAKRYGWVIALTVSLGLTLPTAAPARADAPGPCQILSCDEPEPDPLCKFAGFCPTGRP